jgi:enamine deaminase RidA (YjgF/YER057c/UK114 family)
VIHRTVDPAGLFPGAPYHYGALVDGGLLFTAGACPLDAEGRVVPGGAAAQARQAVANLLAVLEEAGGTAADLVKTTVYATVSERSELVEVWAAIEAALAPARPPSTLLGVSHLGYPGQFVEIEAVAMIAPRALR